MSSRKGVDQISDGPAAIGMGSEEGPSEVSVRKSKSKAANSSSSRPWAQQSNAPRAWGQPVLRDCDNNSGKAPAASEWPQLGSGGRGNVRPQLPWGRGFPTNPVERGLNLNPSEWPQPGSGGRGNVRPPQLPSGKGFPTNPAIDGPLERDWNWNARAGATNRQVQDPELAQIFADLNCDNEMKAKRIAQLEKLLKYALGTGTNIDNKDDDSDVDDLDDELLSDEFDSSSSVQSFESRKKNKWLKAFFTMLDKLTVEEINEPDRQWHCPACQNGPGSVDWYCGLQPLMTHAKTKGSKRVRLHRELAELLNEELRRRGTSVIPAGEAFGKWKGLSETVKDREIIWPPMVMIMNTKLEQDDNDKWIGMGKQELLDFFSSYAAVKACHSYGPQGHRGMSVLIFESSAIGYLEAERLNNHFEEQGTGKKAWNRVQFNAGGNRQLYGYMAEKHDLDIFNQLTQVKARLKYEMKSYQEKIVSGQKQMSEDNQQLVPFKDRLAKEKKHSEALEESFGLVSEKLRRTFEECRIVRQRSKVLHEENKQAMDFLEDIIKNQMKDIHDERVKKEESFEMLQQEERQKVKQSKASWEDEVQNFIKSQDKEMEDFVRERDNLMKIYEEKKAAMKKRLYDEEVELEKKIDAQLDQLMDNYTSHHTPHTVKIKVLVRK